MILLLLLSSSLLFAQEDKELVTCKFLDQFFDFKITDTEEQDDILYIQGPELEYTPDDCYDDSKTE